MFANKIYFLSGLFLIAAFYTVWVFYTPTSRNYRDYQRLMHYSDAVKIPEETQNLAQQERDQTSRQFIFTQGTERLQWLMKSAKSTICLEQIDNSLQLKENLKKMSCMMQENEIKISEDLSSNSALQSKPDQIVRYIEAQEALYFYKRQQLVAEQAAIKRYQIPQEKWMEQLFSYQPVMQAQARKIQVDFSKQPTFKAQGFQLIFQDWN